MSRHQIVLASNVEPLAVLLQRVQAFNDLCLPDYHCQLPAIHEEMRFVALDLDAHPGGLRGEEISIRINSEDHLFTEWSRLQLLEHLGTREKWFKRVTLEDQARELTRRVHTFDRHRLRRMRSSEDINFIRGLVSEKYADIPDLEVMKALHATMPDGECVRAYSGKSDKAFYAYTMMRTTRLGIGKDLTGYPGAIIKNSEVGATALIVIPFFLVVHDGGFMRPVALRKQALLRKIHRGQYAELRHALHQALVELQSVWGPLQKRLDGLMAKSFATEQDALDRLSTVLTSMHLTKRFIAKCTTTYSAAKNTAHNGLALFTAVLTAGTATDVDSRYDSAEVAGYLLLHLL